MVFLIAGTAFQVHRQESDVRRFQNSQNRTYGFGVFGALQNAEIDSQSPPKYCKHRTSGQAVVTLDVVDHYLGPHGSKTSIAEYDRLYGDKPVDDFGPVALKSIRQQWIAAGHVRSTINGNVDRIRRAFKWAAAEEMITGGIPVALSSAAGLRKGRSAAVESGSSVADRLANGIEDS